MADSAKTMSRWTKYRTIDATTTAPIIIIGGICIGLGWKFVNGAWNRKPKNNVELGRSMCFAALHGGKLAMERLIDYQNSKGKPEETEADIKMLKTLLNNEQPNFKELQCVLARLEMNRREDEAIKVLQKALKKARKEGKSHEAYEIEMLLAEMYIYKGDVQQALECQCLQEEGGSDARNPLYKAIISMMEQKEEEALEHWKEFKERQHLLNPPSVHDEEFVAFKNAVNLLKKDIDSAATQLKRQ